MQRLIRNVKAVTPEGIRQQVCVLVDGDKISYFGPEAAVITGDEIIDGQGLYLAPGFIDLHIHGGNGGDFMDGTAEAFQTVAAYHSRHGVTSMLATTLAGGEEETAAALQTFCDCAADITACNLLGVHMEGPYFSQEQRGAQDPAYIGPPDHRQYERYLSYGCIKRWSIAPELDGSLTLGDKLAAAGIIVSAAHTEADFDTMRSARKHGYHLLTHLYSGMQGVHRKGAERYGGAVEACLLLDDLDAEIIADGCHLPPCLLQLVYKCKGPDHILLTADAMRGAGLKEGEMTVLGSLAKGQPVIIEDGVAKLPDRTSFAGSIASGDRLVRTMWKGAGIPLPEAVTMLTVNPARKLGLAEHKGRLAEQYDADLVLFDEDVKVKMVMNGGRIVFGAPKQN